MAIKFVGKAASTSKEFNRYSLDRALGPRVFAVNLVHATDYSVHIIAIQHTDFEELLQIRNKRLEENKFAPFVAEVPVGVVSHDYGPDLFNMPGQTLEYDPGKEGAIFRLSPVSISLLSTVSSAAMAEAYGRPVPAQLELHFDPIKPYVKAILVGGEAKKYLPDGASKYYKGLFIGAIL